ncbi:four-helix bundle copper-binding protein [Mycetocola zhujimingii]|uniref:Four-helix bundle copper-binding protein n=1 Tax=Mycetocola zhujimingii TaxID=2079792 RepID=A0A2U1TH27_9MICO|nr:four-helix bundle copper-binding protein [Mycetocola zhujimingii]PWC08093.1 four-helix bundle copper-binding protein [Mycetocola zhujimingii]
MGFAESMLLAYPGPLPHVDRIALTECIEACMESAQIATACAEACLSEPDLPELAECIRASLDCSDVAGTTAKVLSRHPGYDANLRRALLAACRAASALCAEQCERFAEAHRHCRVCAEACRRTEAACERLLDV